MLININDSKLVTYKIKSENKQQSLKVAVLNDLIKKGIVEPVNKVDLSSRKVNQWLNSRSN